MDGKQWNELIKKLITKTKYFNGKLIILPLYHMIFPNEIDLETHFSKAEILIFLH